jgi:hypothetical protein
MNEAVETYGHDGWSDVNIWTTPSDVHTVVKQIDITGEGVSRPVQLSLVRIHPDIWGLRLSCALGIDAGEAELVSRLASEFALGGIQVRRGALELTHVVAFGPQESVRTSLLPLQAAVLAHAAWAVEERAKRERA